MKVSSTCLVTVARNRYSVPCEWAGQMVSTHLYPAQIVVGGGDTVVATHERLSDRNQTRYDWQHYVPLIERKPGRAAQRRALCRPARAICSACAKACCTRRAATG